MMAESGSSRYSSEMDDEYDFSADSTSFSSDVAKINNAPEMKR